MLTDKQAKHATNTMMVEVIKICEKYAALDDLPIRFVLSTVGEALIFIANKD